MQQHGVVQYTGYIYTGTVYGNDGERSVHTLVTMVINRLFCHLIG